MPDGAVPTETGARHGLPRMGRAGRMSGVDSSGVPGGLHSEPLEAGLEGLRIGDVVGHFASQKPEQPVRQQPRGVGRDVTGKGVPEQARLRELVTE